MIEKVAGEDYFSFLSDHVLKPLNMTSTGTTVSLRHTGYVAQAYGDNGGRGPVKVVPYKDPEVSYSAGMPASNIDDLLKYVDALVDALLDHRLLSEQAYQTYWYTRPNLPGGKPSPWAFGWASKTDYKFAGARVISMNGGTPGAASTIILLPERKCAVIALCNLRKPPSYAIARKVAALAFGSAVTEPAEQGETPFQQGADEEAQR